jgi:ribosomal protein S18 acetylase RimI-like enzyme
MNIQEIPFGSDDYNKECTLRNEVLRLPLGLNLFDEDLSSENQQMHFGMFDPNGNLIACVIGVARSPIEAKIRQMAVDPEHQGKGYGSRIICFLEEFLAPKGFTHFSMHARLSAVGFYEKLGYVKVGPIFTEVRLPHVQMEKSLAPVMPVER